MNTLRNELKANYSQIPNELITDLTLSSGALRVLLYLFTKPDNWNVYNADICKQLDISEKTLTKYWNELLSSKWLRREKKQTKDGKFTGGYSYLIGSFTISEESSESEESSDHSNNIPIQKKETNISYDDFYLLWNNFANKNNLSKIAKLSDSRKKKILARLKDFKDFKDFKVAFEVALKKANESYFLLNSSFFTFDWLVENDTNILKVLEDKYKDKTNSNIDDKEWSYGAIRCDPNEYR